MSGTPFRSDAFSGKVIGITGAAKNLGRAAARLLASLGASLVIVDNDEASAHALEKEFKEAGRPILMVVGDVGDREVLQDAIQGAVERWGGLDSWISNATINLAGPFEQLSPADFQRMISVNLFSAWEAARIALPHLERRKGSLLHITSIMSEQPNGLSAAYGMAKGGLDALTRALAVELAPRRIRVNSLRVGHIAEGKIRQTFQDAPPEELRLREEMADLVASTSAPWPEVGRLDDFAQAVAFLLSDAANYVTGVVLPVDGGYAVSLRPVYDDRRGEAYVEWKKAQAKLHRLLEEPRQG